MKLIAICLVQFGQCIDLKGPKQQTTPTPPPTVNISMQAFIPLNTILCVAHIISVAFWIILRPVYKHKEQTHTVQCIGSRLIVQLNIELCNT